jgi:hypothetical protein
MERRRLLRRAGVITTIGIAGCGSSSSGRSTEGDQTARSTATTGTPEPESASVGDALTVDSDLRVRIDDVRFQHSVFLTESFDSGFSTATDIEVFSAPSDSILAVISLTVENTGTESTGLESGTLSLSSGEYYSGDAVALDAVVGIEGVPFPTGGTPELEPSQTQTGWYLAQIPRETASEGITISVPEDSSSSDVSEWEYASSDAGIPDFSATVEAPSSSAMGIEYQFTVTVTNDGAATGVYRDVAQYYSTDEEDWRQLRSASNTASLETRDELDASGVIATEVPAGGSTEVTFTNWGIGDRQYRYRLHGGGSEWETEFAEGTFSLGETVRTDSSRNITALETRSPETLRYDPPAYDERAVEPEDGNQFLAVKVRYERRVPDRSASNPSSYSFEVVDGNETIADNQTRPTVSTFDLSPSRISSPWFTAVSDAGDLSDRQEVTGWLVYQIPESRADGDIAIRYSNDYGGFRSEIYSRARWELDL